MDFRELEKHMVWEVQPVFKTLTDDEASIRLKARADALGTVMGIVEGLESKADKALLSRRNHTYALVSGLSGLGKTRFGLELCHLMSGPSRAAPVTGEPATVFQRCATFTTYNHTLGTGADRHFDPASRLALRLLYSALVKNDQTTYVDFCASFNKRLDLRHALKLILQLRSQKHQGQPVSMVVVVDEFQREGALSDLVSDLTSALVSGSLAPHRVQFVFTGLYELPISKAMDESTVQRTSIRLAPLSFLDALEIANSDMFTQKTMFDRSYIPYLYTCASVPKFLVELLQERTQGRNADDAFQIVLEKAAEQYRNRSVLPSDELYRAFASSVARIREPGSEETQWADKGICHIIQDTPATIADVATSDAAIARGSKSATSSTKSATDRGTKSTTRSATANTSVVMSDAATRTDSRVRVVVPYLLIFLQLQKARSLPVELFGLDVSLKYQLRTDNVRATDTKISQASERLAVFGHAVMLQSLHLLEPNRYHKLSHVLMGAALSPSAKKIEVRVRPVGIMLAKKHLINNQKSVFTGRDPRLYTGKHVVELRADEAVADAMVVFREARVEGETKTFPLIVLDSRKMKFNENGLQYAIMRKGLAHCQHLLKFLQDTNELQLKNARIMFGAVNTVFHLTKEFYDALDAEDGLAFAMGAKEAKKHYEYIPAHPLVSPVVHINEPENQDLPLHLAQLLPWGSHAERLERATAILAKVPIKDQDALISAATLPGEDAATLQEIWTGRQLPIDYTEWL
jgi:hypothetical protein